MTKREYLKTELLRKLAAKLKEYDFRLNKARAEFIQRVSIGWFKYQIVFKKTDNGWDLKPSLLLRFDEVEDIFHNISEFEAKYQKDTPTIGISIEDYKMDSNNYRYQLTEEEQLDFISQKLFVLFQKEGIPFLQRYNTIGKLDAALNNNLHETSLTGGIFKGTKAIIVAKLSNRANFKELERFYLDYYENFANGFYLESYLSLINYLSTSVRL